MWLRACTLVCFFLFCLPSLSFSDVVLTDGEYQEVMDKIDSSDLQFSQAQEQLVKATDSLAVADQISKTLEASLRTQETVSLVLGTTLVAVLGYSLLVHFQALPP